MYFAEYINKYFEGNNYEKYIGRIYNYCNSEYEIISIKDDSFEIKETKENVTKNTTILYHIESFIDDVKKGVYKRVK